MWSKQLHGLEFVEVTLVSACLAVDAIVDGTENDNWQVERSHRCRYRQILVGFQKLDVTVVDGNCPSASMHDHATIHVS